MNNVSEAYYTQTLGKPIMQSLDGILSPSTAILNSTLYISQIFHRLGSGLSLRKISISFARMMKL